MKRKIYLGLTILGLLSISSSCTKSTDGDDWTPKKRISLGSVSIMIPETYMQSISNSSIVDYDNGFEGGSVAIKREALAGRTQTEVFDYKIANFTYSDTPTTSDTTLLGYDTKIIEGAFAITLNTGHPVIDYVFIVSDVVYTLEFSWSQDTDSKSRALMQEMLATLQIQ